MKTYRNILNVIVTMNKDDYVSTIKNLVISGGGIAGFAFYGALKQLSINGIWNINNIENIYATSIGTVISVMLSLKYSWEELDDFIILRPWHRVFKFDFTMVLNAIENRGIFNNEIMKEILKPLLLGKELDIDISLKTFYEKTGINIHFICTNLYSMNSVNISHKTHPDWQLVDAIYCSCSLPICFSPYLYENTYLCDGGFVDNYPIDICLKDGHKEYETIGIGFYIVTDDEKSDNEINNDNFNLFDYILTLIMNLIRKINTKNNNNSLYKEVLFDPNASIFNELYNTINMKDIRKELMTIGMEKADEVCLESSMETID